MAWHSFHQQHKTTHYDNNHFKVLPPKNRRHIYTSRQWFLVCVWRLTCQTCANSRAGSLYSLWMDRDSRLCWACYLSALPAAAPSYCFRGYIYIIYTEWWADIFSSGRGGKNLTQKWVPIERSASCPPFSLALFFIHIYPGIPYCIGDENK